MEKLPDDCLSQIFFFLQDDKVSLHASILVNRQWCKNGIKDLWRQPFRLVMADKNTEKYKSGNRISTGMLMEIVLSCLIDLSSYNPPRSYNLRNPSKATLGKAHVFNYIGFIRKLDLDDLGLAIAEWTEYCFSPMFNQNAESVNHRNAVFSALSPRRVTRFTSYKDLKGNNSFIKGITERICKLLMMQIPRLDSISIKPVWFDRCVQPSAVISEHFHESSAYSNITNEYLGLVTYPNANICLSKLTEFSWIDNYPRSIQVIQELSSVATNIRKISFGISLKPYKGESSAFEAMISLIQVQSALSDFELQNLEISSPLLMEALARHKNVLTRLCFKCVNISASEDIIEMVQFKKLEELIIISSKLENTYHWPISLSHFPNLIAFQIDDVCPTSIVTGIDEDHGTSGNQLCTFIYNQVIYNSESARSILEAIDHCTNLTYFECNAEIDSINLLKQIFMSSTRLQTIIVKNRRRSLNINELLKVVRLTRLSHLELEGSWRFTSDSLEVFLNNSNPPLKTLSLHYSSCFEDDHLEVLLRSLSGVLEKIDLKGMIKRLSFDSRKRAHQAFKEFYYGK
ncbi:9737_t:CDS:1 [Acaulospora morrowiae]|uniref:9737_t:CDS:1 n=1 Tax=Acaulospora morrowiae TaxID=94023 RepID=A0A9N9CVB5_9GLOM|nr:9737_t:CDS:1 [Acaulospora morrowiae]